MLKINACAKINLFLDVLDRRADGYHDIRTVIQSVSLCDRLSFNVTCGKSSVLYDEFPGKDKEDDLVYKAWKVVRERSDKVENILIDVKKSIPVAAGLGGGSADAAGTLVGLNSNCRLSLSDKQLRSMAADLGADVPFFLKGGTYLAEAIGTELKELPPMPECFVVIMDPGVEVSTTWAYKAFDEVHWKDPKPKQDISGLLHALKEGDYKKVCASLYNAFEDMVFDKYPQVGQLKTIAMENGADAALMSGSGPAVFALALSESQAERIKKKVSGLVKDAYLCRTCQSGLEIVE